MIYRKVIFQGISCGNPDCNFKDDDIKFENYKKMVGKRCPKCGNIIFLYKDYRRCEKISEIVRLLNMIFKDDKKPTKIIKITICLNKKEKTNL